MRLSRTLALGASLLVLISACTTGGGSKATIKIGSDGFYEAKLVAEMYAQVLEADGYTVDRSLGLGPRKVTTPAIENGDIDLKPEYLGSGLAFFDASKPSSDSDANKAALQSILATKGGGITVLGYTPGEDTNAFVVRGDDATAFDCILLGAKGDISVTANVAPKLMHEMCKLGLERQEKDARAINERLMGLHKNLFIEANPIPVKWALMEMGLIKGGIRLPLTPLAQKHHETVRQAMRAAGVIS